MTNSSLKTFRERAAEAAGLAAQIRDPQLRKACFDLADGWTRLARQQEASGGSPTRADHLSR